jgi:Flp pilus assembly protein TadG
MARRFATYSRTSRRRGATLVETAIVIGACLFFLFAIFEYGRCIMLRQLLANATREAARYAVWNTNTQPTPDLKTYMTTYLAGQPLSITTFSAFQADPNNSYTSVGPWQNAPFGQPIVVQVQASYTPILPSFGFLPNPVTIKDEATMYSEGN